jgi:hypothetical protein
MRDIEQYKQIIVNYNIQNEPLYISKTTFGLPNEIIIDNTLKINQCEEILTTLSQQPKINCLYINLLDNANFYEALQQALPKLSNITNIVFVTPPFPTMKSFYQLLSQLKNHPTLKSLGISHSYSADLSNAESVLQALAIQTFSCLQELDLNNFTYKALCTYTSPLITTLTKNNLFTLKIFIQSSCPMETEGVFSLSNLIKELPKTHLMNLSLYPIPLKEVRELIRILPFTYIRTLEVFIDHNPKENASSVPSQITQNPYLIYDICSKNNHHLHFTFKDILSSSPSRLFQPVKSFFHKVTRFFIFNSNHHSPPLILNKFVQSLKAIITNIKNSPIYSEYKCANTIPNLWLIFNPILFKGLSILLKNKYNKYLNNKEFELIQDNKSILSKLAPPSSSQFVKLLGYKPSDNSPEPPLYHLSNNTWMRFIVPNCMEIEPHQLLSPFATPTKTAKSSSYIISS